MRLPTGVPLGSELSESGRVIRMLSGSSPSTSPITVPTMVSWPWPEEVVCMVAVMVPLASTWMRQEFHEGRGGDLRIEQGLEGGVAAARLEAGGDADAGELAVGAQRVAPRLEVLVAGVRQHLVDDGVVVAAVVEGAARDQVGEFVVADQIAPPHLEPVEPERIGDLVHGALDGEIGRRPGRRRAPLPAWSCW